MAIDRETLENLHAWHWEFGAHRMGRFNLPNDWFSNLVDIEEGRVARKDQQREILFWGQSSAFSSVYLTNAFGKCLGGYGDLDSKTYAGVSADQTGIAVRFSSIDTAPDALQNHARVNLMSLSDIVSALALGYAAHEVNLTPVSAVKLESFISTDSSQTGAEPEALDLLAAGINAISALVDSEHSRMQELSREGIWDKQYKSACLRNPDLRKRPKMTESLIARTLWDDNEDITNFFDSLRRYYASLIGKLAGRPLYVSEDVFKLVFASDDKFITLDSRIDRRKPKDAQDFIEKVRAVVMDDLDDYCVLKLGTENADFFQTETEFTLFVGLIKEVVKFVTPDSSGQLEKASESYFNSYDIIDLPKPGYDYSAFDQGRVWSLETPRGESGMARRLLRHGKAEAAILYKMPEVSALVFITSPDYPKSLPQIGPKFVDKFATVHVVGGMDSLLSDEKIAFKDMITRIRDLGGGNDARKPITGLSVNDPGFQELDPMDQDKAADKAASATGFKALFPDAEAEKALFSALVRDDGGMGLVLETTTGKYARRSAIKQKRVRIAEDEIRHLVDQALPQSAFSGTDHKDAFIALAEAIETFCVEPEKLSDKRANVGLVSEKLREAFSLRAENLDPVPRRLGSDHDAASTYVTNQLKRWSSSRSLDELFDLVNFAPHHREEVLKSTQALVPVDEVGIWLTQEFGEIAANREALHCRRYVATRLSKEIFDLSEVRVSNLTDDHVVLQDQLDVWARPTADLADSLHYQIVVSPMVTRLRQVAEIIPKTIWVKQPGDEEIRLIAQTLKIAG